MSTKEIRICDVCEEESIFMTVEIEGAFYTLVPLVTENNMSLDICKNCIIEQIREKRGEK